jgi:uncharacterized protein
MADRKSVVLEVCEAFRKRDIAALFAKFAPDVEIHHCEQLPWGGRHRGAGGLATFLMRLTQAIDPEIVPERYFETGNHIVQIGRTRGRVLATGKEFDVEAVHVWRVRDRKITGLTAYVDTRAMLAALEP